MSVIAKSLDVFVLLKLLVGEESKTYAVLATELGMSASETHASIRRSADAGLIDRESRRVNRKAMEEYLIHGVRYAFPAKRGAVVRGTPTSVAARPLSDSFVQRSELPPVWPDPLGKVKGYGIVPLHRSAPYAARADARLYELLALVDALRDGRARERAMAESKIKEYLRHAEPA